MLKLSTANSFATACDVTTYESHIEHLREIVWRRDECSYEIGYYLIDNITIAPAGGRPRLGQVETTLSAVARDVGVGRSTLSALYDNALFWLREEVAQLSETFTWYQLAEARRACGWRPGAERTPEHVKRALDYLHQQFEPPTTPRPDALVRRVDRMLADVESALAIAEQRKLIGVAYRLTNAKTEIDAARRKL